MKRVFGLVGYACNGKSTIIKQIINNKDYCFIDLPDLYKNEAYKRGYAGVTEWYTAVGLEKYAEVSKKVLLDYIEKEMPRNRNLIIDDIFDIDVYNKLIKVFPQMKLISFHSKYTDRLKRLEMRTGITDNKELIKGLSERDDMKRFCGIEEIFPKCKYEINNKQDLAFAKKIFNSQIKQNQIICIVGYSGSGKSTVSYYLGKKLNIPVFKYGEAVTKIMNDNGYEKSRAFVSANGIEAYSDLVDKEIYQVLKKYMQKNKLFIIDGIVSDEVFDKLKKNNEVYAFYVKLDKKERIKRLNKRESLDLEKALKELDIKDNIKIKCGLDIITSKCSALIDSSQTLEKVVDQISDILEKNI